MSSNPKPLKYFHSIPVQVRFNDVDELGHVNNSVYQQYFDLGRLSYFNQVFEEKMNWNVGGLILASIHIEYLHPIHLYDSIEVHSKIYNLGNKSLKMMQEIVNLTTEQVVATNKAVMVCYSDSRKETLPIPDRWRNSIAFFEKDLEF
ncbi:MAG: acyl-CoA thioesterase [Bacteroidales bacterium]|nr:acyl-CoA thioesterase [Bacteroidales bacterium]HPD94425.1 thioesterase family protein [Tenuifilaceae bacterium]HRX30808.1 thioesterase family protein [Tenuifilaceae bacterium]